MTTLVIGADGSRTKVAHALLHLVQVRGLVDREFVLLDGGRSFAEVLA
ncbi:hypothetical protein [Halomonas sp. NCCP-2165]|nr:hypothetical protein [Halomonas sp. NCCP-2165]GKW50350.1 hypothetical protein NCCP2165_25650 [Halomonas sp. NCCP-2165]